MMKKRDQDIINFLDEFHIATTNQIQKLFFPKSYRYCRNRICYLRDELKVIKECKSTICNGFAYYTEKKPVQTHHDLLRTELFVNLNQRYKVLDWINENPVVNIRPDATAYINKSAFTFIDNHGIAFPIFIEIHLNNKFNFDKYKTLLQKTDLISMYGMMPRVIICTDRKVVIPQGMGIKFKIVDVEMKGLDSIFK